MVYLNLQKLQISEYNTACFFRRKENANEEKVKLQTEIQRETEKLKEISLTVTQIYLIDLILSKK